MSLADFAPATRSAPAPKESEFCRDLVAGLGASPKTAPCKYFYDNEGSALFDRICDLPEYYPTRTEMGILRKYAGEVATRMGPDALLIEYGAGALKKVGLLLDAMEKPRGYVPVDISGEFLHQVAGRLRMTRPSLAVHPVVADFNEPFDLPQTGGRKIGFFPGSTIGNLDRKEAFRFLRRAASLLRGGGMLIGVDLVKDPAILHAAYNDSQGVTEAFNKNLLVRANRELDANFDLDAFAHYAFFNPVQQRIEMHLMSLTAQGVSVGGHHIDFAEGETIHTENSHKHTVEGFRELAAMAGFTPRDAWCDPAGLFSLHWLEATPPADPR